MRSPRPNHVVSHPEDSPRLQTASELIFSASPKGGVGVADALHPSSSITRLSASPRADKDFFFFIFLHSCLSKLLAFSRKHSSVTQISSTEECMSLAMTSN